ncbi:hypothetical protein L1987_11887 [Smallanthus sonchifolius]|uniref:Uncharacterized protein n=1 Tax=Smallanthus sonchifolius TaxID=185202 RepID=A0ACB9JCP9_9ASTR|nr:hypothetical protein L1987_11887 [Smallanthus sonchifolius]
MDLGTDHTVAVKVSVPYGTWRLAWELYCFICFYEGFCICPHHVHTFIGGRFSYQYCYLPCYHRGCCFRCQDEVVMLISAVFRRVGWPYWCIPYSILLSFAYSRSLLESISGLANHTARLISSQLN